MAYSLITNGQPFRYKVPGFDYAGTANPQVPGDVFRNRNSPGDTPQQPPTLDPTKALAYWKDKKLVVLCLSGGAYRATFWSSIVIDHLAKTHPTFKKSVHLITGASGGMVAGAYFAAMQAKAIAGDVTTRIEEETRTALKDEGRALPNCRAACHRSRSGWCNGTCAICCCPAAHASIAAWCSSGPGGRSTRQRSAISKERAARR